MIHLHTCLYFDKTDYFCKIHYVRIAMKQLVFSNSNCEMVKINHIERENPLKHKSHKSPTTQDEINTIIHSKKVIQETA